MRALLLRRSLKVVVAPLLRVLAESDGGCVQKDDRARSVEEVELPKQDDLLFDGCEHDVLMRLMFQAALMHDSVLFVVLRFVDCGALAVISERCWVWWTQMSMPLLNVSLVDHGGR